jgi:hypothetical protein
LESESERIELLEEVIASSLSLSQIRERVKVVQPPTEPPPLATRMETIYKLAKKHHVWENLAKRSRLESLLAQLEELISGEGLDESQPIEEAIATQNQLPTPAKSLQDSLLIESGLDLLESQKGVTEEFSSESLHPPEETTSVPDDRETPSSELLDEPQSFVKEEPTQLGSELTDEWFNKSLTHTEMVERLGVKSSTLSNAKKRANFSSWSKRQDPDGIAWQWGVESKRFVPLKKLGE